MFDQRAVWRVKVFGFSLLFELMDENKVDQMSMVFCDYFYSAVFVKKTVTADKKLGTVVSAKQRPDTT